MRGPGKKWQRQCIWERQAESQSLRCRHCPMGSPTLSQNRTPALFCSTTPLFARIRTRRLNVEGDRQPGHFITSCVLIVLSTKPNCVERLSKLEEREAFAFVYSPALALQLARTNRFLNPLESLCFLLVLLGGGKPDNRRKPVGAGTKTNKLTTYDPHMTSTSGLEPWPHWWVASCDKP